MSLKVFFDTAKFRAFANGFIGATKDSLTEIEIENLVKATDASTSRWADATRPQDDSIAKPNCSAGKTTKDWCP